MAPRSLETLFVKTSVHIKFQGWLVTLPHSRSCVAA